MEDHKVEEALPAPLDIHESLVVQQALAILAKRMVQRDAFTSPSAVKDYMQLHIGLEPVEKFKVLFLDSQNRMITSRVMFTGTLTQTSVYPREVVKAALDLHASAVVFGHNHPSGTVEPSRADEMLTQTLKSALALVDIRVLDHIVVSPGRALSMAEKGLL